MVGNKSAWNLEKSHPESGFYFSAQKWKRTALCRSNSADLRCEQDILGENLPGGWAGGKEVTVLPLEYEVYDTKMSARSMTRISSVKDQIEQAQPHAWDSVHKLFPLWNYCLFWTLLQCSRLLRFWQSRLTLLQWPQGMFGGVEQFSMFS